MIAGEPIRGSLIRCLAPLALATALCSGSLRAAPPELQLDSPQKLLAGLAASRISREDGAGAATLRGSAVRGEVLLRFGRLLPEKISVGQLDLLAAELARPPGNRDEIIGEMVNAYPAADELIFDGEKYAGGNFGFIDAMTGMRGRPVAFDRELPMFLVPLNPEAETALARKREAFQASDETRPTRTAAATRGTPATSGQMFDDGQYLRPYCGRFDDLYFHLFQNGNGASAMAFCAIADGLLERGYHPLAGLVSQTAGPQSGFDVNDILSGGGRSAVRAYAARGGRSGEAAYRGFAYRVVPVIEERIGQSKPGNILAVDETDVRRAWRRTQRLFPARVPPLYRSPDRFLGWTGSFYIPVANVVALPQEVIESYYPLPKRDGENTPEAKAREAAGSGQLFESSSTGELVWEDPQESKLLTNPEDRSAPRRIPAQPPFSTGSPPTPSRPEPDPRRAPPPSRLLAVVTPTEAEAKMYFAAIEGNDARLRAAEQLRRRIQRLRVQLESARTALPANLGNDLVQSVTDDLAGLDLREREVSAELLETLQERASVRATLEHRLQVERVAPLEALGKKEEAAPAKGRPTVDL